MKSSLKKLSWWAVLLVVMVIGAAPLAAAQEMKEIPEAALAAAKRAFEQTLEVTRRTGTYEVLGMRAEADTRAAVLGPPVRVREIGYDLLVARPPAGPAQGVFTASEQVLFPILVDQRARALIALARSGEEWRLTSYGDPDRAAAVEAVKSGLAREKGVAASQAGAFSLLTAPAFQLDLLAVTLAQRTHVMPLSPVAAAEYGIEGVMELPQAIDKLSAYAKAFDAKYGEQIRQRRLAK